VKNKGQNGPLVSIDRLDNVFQQFLRERTYLNDISPKT
jgi:hypothetical protein